MLGLRRLSAIWRVEPATVPGCLKSESEERETWTAESLRAASNGRSLLRSEVRPERDFGGYTFFKVFYIAGRASDRTCRDLVKMYVVAQAIASLRANVVIS